MALRWSAVKIIDDDTPTIEALELTDGEAHLIDEIVEGLEAKLGERDMIIADQKYRFICRVCEQCLTREKDPGELTISDRIDKIATHKVLALPLFIGIMLLVFFITFGPLGTFLTDGLDGLINNRFAPWVREGLTAVGAPPGGKPGMRRHHHRCRFHRVFLSSDPAAVFLPFYSGGRGYMGCGPPSLWISCSTALVCRGVPLCPCSWASAVQCPV